MPSVIKTTVGKLARWVMDKLATVEGLNSNTVSFSRMSQSPRFTGDRDAILRIGRPRAIDGLMSAGFEVTPAVVRAFVIQLRYRWLGDQSDRSNAWLLQEPTEDFPDICGQSLYESRVIKVLCDYTFARPYDEDENLLTISPILLVDGKEFEDELHQIPPDDPTWGSSSLILSVSYLCDTGSLEG